MPDQHPLTETAAAELWDARLDGSFWRELNPDQRENALTDMRSGWDAAMRAATPADPHYDPRPWQECAKEDIRKGDLVEAQDSDLLIVGVAHSQDENGDWYTEDGIVLTYGLRQSLRRIPAPIPPADEVELPAEPPAHLTDVEDAGGDVCAYMALDRNGRWRGVDQNGDARGWGAWRFTAFTLPDGTRARRDGERFVKVRKGEK